MHPIPPTMTSLPEVHILPHPSSTLTSFDFTSPPTPFALKQLSIPPVIPLHELQQQQQQQQEQSSKHSSAQSSPDSTMRHTPASSRGNSAPNTPPLSILTPEDKDVFRLPAVEALRLMARSIEVLVSFTGDVPPTPPLSHPNSPALSAVDDKGLQTPSESPNMDASTLNSGFSFGSESSCDLDGVKAKKRSQPTQEEEGKFIAAGVDNAIQYGAITRKFWSKSVPEIPIEDYIFRIHRFCPMSTAVYIAASVYLHRLAVVDRILPITRYNVHRLVLASLRVASKACEDLSHSHKRFAKVGGLSENELSRLEVSFCFLVNFELQISKSTMERQVAALRNIAATQVLMGKPALQPRIPKDMQHRSTPQYVDC